MIADFIVWCITRWAGRVTALVLLAVVGFIGWHMEYGTEHTVTFTVNGLNDQSTGNGHKYLVFATRADGKDEVFENTDARLHGKNDSSDVWARFIEAGKGATWRCPVYGFRIFLNSSYRDILDGCVLLSKPGQAQTSPSVATPTGSDPLSLGWIYPSVPHGLAA